MDQVNSELAELAAMEMMENDDDDVYSENTSGRGAATEEQIAEFGRVLFLQGVLGGSAQTRQREFDEPSPLRRARVPI
jgi:hypothetical protein